MSFSDQTVGEQPPKLRRIPAMNFTGTQRIQHLARRITL